MSYSDYYECCENCGNFRGYSNTGYWCSLDNEDVDKFYWCKCHRNEE